MKQIRDDQKIPLLKLDLGCEFTATCSAYIQYKVCIRIDREEENQMIFNSTEFEVAITGDKLLFQPVDVKLPGELQETVVVIPTRHNATIARSSVPPIMKYTESGPVDEHEPIPFPLNADANAIVDIEDWIKLKPKDIKDTKYVYLANPAYVSILS